VDADEATPLADEALERCLLLVVQHVAGRAQEDDCTEARQAIIGELTCIFGGGGAPAAFSGKPHQRLHGGRDRLVAVAGGPREDEQ